jgi:type I restriction enzyme S subunit
VIYHYHVWKLSLHSESDLDKNYLYNFLAHKTQEIKDSGHGVSMIHMTKGKMEMVQVPVPPLAEQHRIVAKVDELMSVCDQLETQLTTTQTDSRRLLEAVLHEALAPATDEERAA